MDDGVSLAEWSGWAQVALLVGAIILLVVGLLLARGLVRLLARLIGGAMQLLGPSTGVRLLSVGAATLLVSEAVTGLGELVAQALYVLVARLPSALETVWARASARCMDEHTETRACLDELGVALLRAWSEMTRQLGSPLLGLPGVLVDVLLWLAVAVIVSRLLGGTGEAETPSLGDRLRAMSPQARRNLAFLGILLGGAYLSVAAVTAIPSLDRPEMSEDVSPERLDEQLRGQAITTEQFNLAYPPGSALGDPFTELEQALNEAEQALLARLSEEAAPPAEAPVVPTEGEPAVAEPAPPSTPDPGAPPIAGPAEILSELRRWRASLESARAWRGQLLESWDSLRSESQQDLEGLVGKAVTHFRTSNLDRSGSRETVRHYQLMDDWFRMSAEVLHEDLAQCRQSLTAADLIWRRWAQEGVRWTRSGLLPGLRLDELRASSMDTPPFEELAMLDLCSPDEATVMLPPRPDLGTGLGPFGPVAGWLLRTESMSLALITGMLGVGLLGAAGAVVIRRGERPVSDDLTADLQSLLIRGTLAALVVFLAVKGGLAIFGVGGSDPNPYVVMLTCFVAAIYSEDVWLRARAWLSGEAETKEEKPPENPP